MGAGLGAGLLAGALTTPADVIKTRLQTDKAGRYKGILDCMGQVGGRERVGGEGGAGRAGQGKGGRGLAFF